MTKLFRLSWQDITKAVFLVVVGMALVVSYKFFQHQGLVLTQDDVEMLKLVGSVISGSYLVKQLLTDENGKLGGHI